MHSEKVERDTYTMQQVSIDDILELVGSVIGDHEIVQDMQEDSRLLGAIAELDSMAVVNLLLGLEQRFGFYVDDDEVDVDIFETVGSLMRFAQGKIK